LQVYLDFSKKQSEQDPSFDDHSFAIHLLLASLAGLLLDRGARINQTDLSGLTALYEAVKCNDLPMVTFLLKRGADPNLGAGLRGVFTPLFDACENNHCEVLLALLDRGAHICCDSFIMASSLGHLAIVMTLLSHGAGVNRPNEDGGTALIEAS
jgi:ankyrin repeat protein